MFSKVWKFQPNNLSNKIECSRAFPSKRGLVNGVKDDGRSLRVIDPVTVEKPNVITRSSDLQDQSHNLWWIPFSSLWFDRAIHLIAKWRPINYSFVCMLISPFGLVNMYKKQNNFEVKMRQGGLVGMRTEEWFIGRHFAIRCRPANNFPASAGQIIRSNLFFLGHIPFLAGQRSITIILKL